MLTNLSQRQREIVHSYEGPACPRCGRRLTRDWIRTGIVRCSDCNRDFEATAFDPPVAKPKIAEVAAIGPEGGNACANHARNAATTNCIRCGLFICGLCDMNVGSGSYCPACFDRMRAEGSLPNMATKVRDYMSQARISLIVGFFLGFFLLGPLFGALTLYYQAKGRKQWRARGDDPWTPGAIIIMLLAVLMLVGGMTVDGFVVYSFFHDTSAHRP